MKIKIDHILPEEIQFETICEELMAISRRLQDLLPDPTLSPEERIERLGRVAPHSVVKSENMKTARTKLNALRLRLSELVPASELTALEKIEFLVKEANRLVPEETSKFFLKLEKIGDDRISDIGR